MIVLAGKLEQVVTATGAKRPEEGCETFLGSKCLWCEMSWNVNTASDLYVVDCNRCYIYWNPARIYRLGHVILEGEVSKQKTQFRAKFYRSVGPNKAI